jgi:hypothetical protein
MDKNIKLHRQLLNQKKVRRAAGGESLTHVATLEFDLETTAEPTARLDFDFDFTEKRNLTFERLEFDE